MAVRRRAVCLALVMAVAAAACTSGDDADVPQKVTESEGDGDAPASLAIEVLASELEVRAGTSAALTLRLTVPADRHDLDVSISAPADVNLPAPPDISGDGPATAGAFLDTLRVEVPLGRPAGEVTIELAATACRVAESPCPDGEVERAEDVASIPVHAADDRTIPDGLSDPIEDRVVVDAAAGVTVVADELLLMVAADPGAADDLVREIVRDIDAVIIGGARDVGLYQVRLPAPRTVDDLLALSRELLQAHGGEGLSAAVPNTANTADDANAPGDYEGSDVTWDAPTSVENWHWQFLDMPEAWGTQTGSTDVHVAIVDQGINADHADLRNRLGMVEHDLETTMSNHGMHVSALACAEANNGRGVVGAMWDCTLDFHDWGAVDIASLSDAGREGSLRVFNSSLFWGMLRAAAGDPDVVNVSAGNGVGCSGDVVVDAALVETIAQGYLFAINRPRADGGHPLWLFSAGNDCRNGDDYRFTAQAAAQAPHALVVASVNSDGRLASYSNFGSLTDIAAPGGQLVDGDDIVTPSSFFDSHSGGVQSAFRCQPGANGAEPLGSWTCNQRNNPVGWMTGTSQATPIVTGIAGLLKAQNPDLDGADLASCLVSSARERGRQVQSPSTAVAEAWGHPVRADQAALDGLFIVDPVGALTCATDGPTQTEPEDGTGEPDVVQQDVLPGITFDQPGAGWTLDTYEPRISHDDRIMWFRDGTFATDILLDAEGGTIEDYVARQREDFEREFPGEWQDDWNGQPYDVPGAIRALRYAEISMSGDVRTDSLLIQVTDQRMVQLSYSTYIEDEWEDPEPMFASVRVDAAAFRAGTGWD